MIMTKDCNPIQNEKLSIKILKKAKYKNLKKIIDLNAKIFKK